MKLLSYLKYPILLIIASCFFFPFEFTFLPGVNTKMMLAALGLVLFVIRSATSRSASLDRDFFVLTIFAAIVSLVGIASVAFNNTTDLTYASYKDEFNRMQDCITDGLLYCMQKKASAYHSEDSFHEYSGSQQCKKSLYYPFRSC